MKRGALSFLNPHGITVPYGPPLSSKSILDHLASDLQRLADFVKPKIFFLESSFTSDHPDNNNILRTGTGFFVGPNLLLTSAHVIARIITNTESSSNSKPKHSDRFEHHGSIVHNAYIANTVAFKTETEMYDTEPLALSFTDNLAVLRVVKSGDVGVDEEKDVEFVYCCVDDVPVNKHHLFVNIGRTSREAGGYYHKLGTPRDVVVKGEETVRVKERLPLDEDQKVRAKAPWPLDGDETRWLGFKTFMCPNNVPIIDCSRLKKEEEVSTGVVCEGGFGGSPWFNFTKGDVVGINSWKHREFPLAYAAVPALGLRSVLNYATHKEPEDPVVMDRWIEPTSVIRPRSLTRSK